MVEKITRKNFNKIMTAGTVGLLSTENIVAKNMSEKSMTKIPETPRAVAMWDFSWLERRWLGAGYEDWDKVLDELAERGYDTVRIDAYPHLMAVDAYKTWRLNPEWGLHEWGSPAPIDVQIEPNFTTFIKKCAERHIKVYLSTWWRNDTKQSVKLIKNPQDLGGVWKTVLDRLADTDLLNHIELVDLCNEYPHPDWPKFLPENYQTDFSHQDYFPWMTESISYLKEYYPNLNYTFSFFGDEFVNLGDDLSFMDVLELHVWMENFSDFTQILDYKWDLWEWNDYYKMQNAKELYYRKPDYWKAKLQKGIDFAVNLSKVKGKPLATTESWGPITYKDWPLMNWKWVKEICEYGVVSATQTDRWIGMSTSNFCGPQFKGMWNDIEWHQRLTTLIKKSPICNEFYLSLDD